MSAFSRQNIRIEGAYVWYTSPGEADRFIARFKFNHKLRGRFITRLIRDWTPEEYFALIEDMSPLEILWTKDPTFNR